MLKIVVKILVFNYLLGLRYSRYWSSKQEKSYGLNDKEISHIWSTARHAAIFICIACE
jgi:Tfp pilus assembly protein PilO